MFVELTKARDSDKRDWWWRYVAIASVRRWRLTEAMNTNQARLRSPILFGGWLSISILVAPSTDHSLTSITAFMFPYMYVCICLSLCICLCLCPSVRPSLTHSLPPSFPLPPSLPPLPPSLLPSLILSPGVEKMSRKLNSLLENIAKSAWCVLQPGGTITCWKWRVCTDLKNAHAILCDSIVKIFLFESKGNRRFFTLRWNRLQGLVTWSLC